MQSKVIRTQEFAHETAEAVANAVRRSQGSDQYCVLGLSGGSTPRPVYERLASLPGIQWDKLIITFGDERCVPPDHRDSNYAMVRAALLDRAGIPTENVLRMKGEMQPDEAALDYERQLDDLASRLGRTSISYDLLLLGIGDDGHTASLFPGTTALSVTIRRVVENYVPKLSSYRLTLTLPFINTSKLIFFLMNDPKKSGILEEVLRGTEKYPAAHVKPRDGSIFWYVGS
jgi:6-phosphogluconolactonase